MNEHPEVEQWMLELADSIIAYQDKLPVKLGRLAIARVIARNVPAALSSQDAESRQAEAWREIWELALSLGMDTNHSSGIEDMREFIKTRCVAHD